MSKPHNASPRSTDKLMAPRLHATIIKRGDLLKQLDISRTQNLTLVTAPTGFGKTTLVSQWIASQDIPFAWVTLAGCRRT